LSFKERKCHQRKDIKTLYFIILQLKQFFFHDINDSIKFSTKELLRNGFSTELEI
jgi:hypothetical protein